MAQTTSPTKPAGKRFAAIDIGTVTCRLLIADVDDVGAIHDVRRETNICNLGVGVDKTGLLDPAAMTTQPQ